MVINGNYWIGFFFGIIKWIEMYGDVKRKRRRLMVLSLLFFDGEIQRDFLSSKIDKDSLLLLPYC